MLFYRNRTAYRTFILIMAFITVLSLSGCGVTGRGEKPRESETLVSAIYASNEISLAGHIDVLNYMTSVGDKIVIAGTKDSLPAIYIMNANGGDGQAIFPDIQGVICGISSDNDAFWVLSNGENGYVLEKYDITGALQNQISPQYAETQYRMCPTVTEDGLLLLWNSSELRLYDQNGVLCKTLDHGDDRVMAVGADAEGIIIHSRLGNQTRSYLLSDQILEPCDFLFSDTLASDFTTAIGTQSAYPINVGYSLFLYDRTSDTYVKAFDWNLLSINGDAIISIIAPDEESYFCMSSEDSVIYKVRRQTNEETRRRITIGTLNEQHVSMLVNEFNKTNQAYYIEIITYPMDDFQRLYTEIIAGKGPDILDIGWMYFKPTSPYLEDLLPYIDEDGELSREDFVDSVFDALTVDGKVTSLPTSFSIYTLAGRTSDVGKSMGWTMNDLMVLLEEKGEEVMALPPWLPENAFLAWVCSISTGEFVNWDKKECYFDSDAFIQLLEFCHTLPLTQNLDGYVSDYVPNVLLTLQALQNLSLLKTIKRNYAGDEFTYIGFPGNSGIGSYFEGGAFAPRLAILAGSGNKSGAWEFVRSAFLPSWQQDQDRNWGIPIIESALNARISGIIKDEDSLLNREDLDKFLNLLEETDLFTFRNDTITEIINEEAAPYLAGEKSAGEVAAIIQNRVSIYVSES